MRIVRTRKSGNLALDTLISTVFLTQTLALALFYNPSPNPELKSVHSAPPPHCTEHLPTEHQSLVSHGHREPTAAPRVPADPPPQGTSVPPSSEAQSSLSLSLCFSDLPSPADLAASSWSIDYSFANSVIVPAIVIGTLYINLNDNCNHVRTLSNPIPNPR